MKYCTHCGKELFDEAIICPGCGVAVESFAEPKKKAKEKKPVNKKKVLITAIAIAAALLLLAGGIVGLSIYTNYAHALQLETQLVGKTYEYKETDAATGDYSKVCWLSFAEGGEYKYEVADFAAEYSEHETGNYSVAINSDGVAEILMDDFAFDCTINENSHGEIEGLSVGYDTYDPIERDPEYALAKWFEGEIFQRRLESNRQEALNFFASTSYWDNGDSFNNLIPIIFKDYDLTCEPVGDSNEEFIIKLSGYYYINKVSLPTITEYGEMTCRMTINPMESAMKIESDDGIVEAMSLYVILSTYGSYGW